MEFTAASNNNKKAAQFMNANRITATNALLQILLFSFFNSKLVQEKGWKFQKKMNKWIEKQGGKLERVK